MAEEGTCRRHGVTFTDVLRLWKFVQEIFEELMFRATHHDAIRDVCVTNMSV